MHKPWMRVSIAPLIAFFVFSLLTNSRLIIIGMFFLLISALFTFASNGTSVVVCSRLHNAVHRVVSGAATLLPFPFWEKKGPTIDPGQKQVYALLDNVLQSNQISTTRGFYIDIIDCLIPEAIPVSRLGKILLQTAKKSDQIVQNHTGYCLHRLLANANLNHLHNRNLGRLEHLLGRLLETHLQKREFGIEIQGARPKILASPELRKEIKYAERQITHITLEATHLATMLQTVADRSESANRLARLMLAHSSRQNNQTLTVQDPSLVWHAFSAGTEGISPPLSCNLISFLIFPICFLVERTEQSY